MIDGLHKRYRCRSLLIAVHMEGVHVELDRARVPGDIDRYARPTESVPLPGGIRPLYRQRGRFFSLSNCERCKLHWVQLACHTSQVAPRGYKAERNHSQRVEYMREFCGVSRASRLLGHGIGGQVLLRVTAHAEHTEPHQKRDRSAFHDSSHDHHLSLRVV